MLMVIEDFVHIVCSCLMINPASCVVFLGLEVWGDYFLGGVGGGILETENIDGQNVAPHPGIVLGIHLALKGLQPSSLSVM